jgi:DNA polymerase I
MQQNKFLLIDGHDHLHRSFYAFPDTLTHNGEPVNAVYGFCSLLLSALNTLNPQYIAVAFDLSRKDLKRTALFEGYKATRPKMDPELRESFIRQENEVKELLKLLNIPIVTQIGFEADDIIGSFAKQAFSKFDSDAYIHTNDKDMLQLIDEHVFVCRPARNGNSAICWNQNEFVKEYGFQPINLIDYKSIKGDPSDNIPGVYGIGDVTAKKLIQEYKTLDNIYSNINKITPVSLREKLEKYKDNAQVSHKLATINTSLDLGIEKNDLRWKNTYSEEFINMLSEYNFKSLINRYFSSKVLKIEEKNNPQLSLI